MRGLFWLYALAYQPAFAPAQSAGAPRTATHACDDSLPADRLRQLKQRIREGFYRQPEVLDDVARPLTDDLMKEDRDDDLPPPAMPPASGETPE
ncbi:MAG: hypothetical protein GVY12_06945 [Bacteroidetes bacterium]|jgi:hypothetical protein|nr:hypothetical protein [Bacteroidota bacterium]